MGDNIYISDSHSQNCYGYTDTNGACCLLEFFGPSRVAALVGYFTTQYNANNTGQLELRSNDNRTNNDQTSSGVNLSDLVQAG